MGTRMNWQRKSERAESESSSVFRFLSLVLLRVGGEKLEVCGCLLKAEEAVWGSGRGESVGRRRNDGGVNLLESKSRCGSFEQRNATRANFVSSRRATLQVVQFFCLFPYVLLSKMIVFFTSNQ